MVVSEMAVAQGDRPKSPRGKAATQISGKWLAVDYGRPILRGRTNIFGTGDAYGQGVLSGAPVWRAGANKSTRLMTDAALMFGDQTVAAGEYSLFVDFTGDGAWTLVVSNHTAKDNYRDEGDGLWGAYDYSPDKDAVRIEMTVEEMPVSLDQFTIAFADGAENGGKIVFWWENTLAWAAFTVAE